MTAPARTTAPALDPLDVAKTKSVKDLKYSSPLIGGRLDPSGKYVFVSAQDNTLQRWDLATGKNVPYSGHSSWVRTLAFEPRSKTLFSGSYAGEIFAWPVEADRPQPRIKLDAHRGWVRAVAVSPDGKTLASCGNDHRVCLWSLPDLKPVREFTGHLCHVYNLTFTPDGTHLVSADLKGIVKDWEVSTGKLVRDLDASILYKYDKGFMADIGGVRSMAFSADASLLACGGITDVTNAFAGVGKPLIVLFDWKTGKQKLLLRPKNAFQGTIWGVAFHPSGWILGAGGGAGGMLWFWKPGEAQSSVELKLPTNARDLDLAPEGKRLAIPFADGMTRIYEIPTK